MAVRLQPTTPRTSHSASWPRSSKASLRLRRRGDRRQSGLRQPRPASTISCACSTTCDRRFRIPTQACVLTHVTTTIELIERARRSILSSVRRRHRGCERFLRRDAGPLGEGLDAARSLRRGTVGENCMYFETGRVPPSRPAPTTASTSRPPSPRLRGLPRLSSPARQQRGRLHRAGISLRRQADRAGRLEDHFCGKLLGLPMGCDICYTNHAEADQDDMDNC